MHRQSVIPIVLVCVLCTLTACGGASRVADSASTPASTNTTAQTELPAVDPATTSGSLSITGSSTVFPLTTAIADLFQQEGSQMAIDVHSTGTGGGFRRFCTNGDIDIVNASRAATNEEQTLCAEQGLSLVPMRVGTDALAVVVNANNTFVQSLTFEQLAAIFSGQATSWADVDPAYPDAPIALFSPGTDSGTFDYFVEQVLDGNDQSIQAVPSIVLSESDVELVNGIAGNANAIGYFGYAYYQAAQQQLKAVPIVPNAGGDAVAPTEERVADGTYPFARPLYIYTAKERISQHPQLTDFITYYLDNVSDVIGNVGYFPANEQDITASRQALGEALP